MTEISSTPEFTISISVEPSNHSTVEAISSSGSTVDSTQTVSSGAQSDSLQEITPSTTATSPTLTTVTSPQPSPISTEGTFDVCMCVCVSVWVCGCCVGMYLCVRGCMRACVCVLRGGHTHFMFNTFIKLYTEIESNLSAPTMSTSDIIESSTFSAPSMSPSDNIESSTLTEGMYIQITCYACV